jgi:hypothetical protein
MCVSMDDNTVYHVGGYSQYAIFCERIGRAYCSCKAFNYAEGVDKTCKHLEQARLEACGWHQDSAPEPQTKPHRCPRCGHKTVQVLVGV